MLCKETGALLQKIRKPLTFVNLDFRGTAWQKLSTEITWMLRKISDCNCRPFYQIQVDEICALVGCYAAWSGNPLQTIRGNPLVPSLRVKIEFGERGEAVVRQPHLGAPLIRVDINCFFVVWGRKLTCIHSLGERQSSNADASVSKPLPSLHLPGCCCLCSWKLFSHRF
jgi:hypothetical protein